MSASDRESTTSNSRQSDGRNTQLPPALVSGSQTLVLDSITIFHYSASQSAIAVGQNRPMGLFYSLRVFWTKWTRWRGMAVPLP